MVFVTVLNLTFAVICYMLLGYCTQGSVTQNFPSGWLPILVESLLCVDLLFTYTIFMIPLSEMIEGLLKITPDRTYFHLKVPLFPFPSLPPPPLFPFLPLPSSISLCPLYPFPFSLLLPLSLFSSTLLPSLLSLFSSPLPPPFSPLPSLLPLCTFPFFFPLPSHFLTLYAFSLPFLFCSPFSLSPCRNASYIISTCSKNIPLSLLSPPWFLPPSFFFSPQS